MDTDPYAKGQGYDWSFRLDPLTASDINALLLTSAKVKQDTAAQCSDIALSAAKMIAETLAAGGKLMLCGNGGSAGDAQHLAAEFVATLDHQRPRAGLPALALTTDTSFITAYANDFGFEGIFARQVETLGRPGDVLICISTSGNSNNVLAAAQAAVGMDIQVIGMTGKSGGKLAETSTICLQVPSDVTMHIQESHIALGHVMTLAVERFLGH